MVKREVCAQCARGRCDLCVNTHCAHWPHEPEREPSWQDEDDYERMMLARLDGRREGDL